MIPAYITRPLLTASQQIARTNMERHLSPAAKAVLHPFNPQARAA